MLQWQFVLGHILLAVQVAKCTIKFSQSVGIGIRLGWIGKTARCDVAIFKLRCQHYMLRRDSAMADFFPWAPIVASHKGLFSFTPCLITSTWYVLKWWYKRKWLHMWIPSIIGVLASFMRKVGTKTELLLDLKRVHVSLLASFTGKFGCRIRASACA